MLTWSAPEAPNGVITSYEVHRDGEEIATVTGDRKYTDDGLTPNTLYSYTIEAFNVIGSTLSQVTNVRTLEGNPTGFEVLRLQALTAFTVMASWSAPTTPNGIIQRFELVRVTFGPEQVIVDEMVVFNGASDVFSTVVSGLLPFTDYTFLIRACTSGGCGSSGPSSVQTLEAPPSFQPAPNVTIQSATSVHVSWSSPPIPNGIITLYELRQRNSPFTGNGTVLISTTALQFVVQGLNPFTMYEFSVVSFTGAGGTRSLWTLGTTDEMGESCSI